MRHALGEAVPAHELQVVRHGAEALEALVGGPTRRLPRMIILEEQARIARELHDQVGQELTAVLFGLRASLSVEDATASQQLVEEARAQTAEALEKVRQIAFDMHPSSLEDVGIEAALQRDLEVIGQRSGFEVLFRVDGAPAADLPPDISIGVYRMVHAALTNIVRHARNSPSRAPYHLSRRLVVWAAWVVNRVEVPCLDSVRLYV